LHIQSPSAVHKRVVAKYLSLGPAVPVVDAIDGPASERTAVDGKYAVVGTFRSDAVIGYAVAGEYTFFDQTGVVGVCARIGNGVLAGVAAIEFKTDQSARL
jgi:hypothetical protein